MSTLLLVLAALFVRGLVSAQTLDRGLVTDGVLAANIDLESAGYDQARGAIVYDQLLERLERTPGLTSATIVDIVPLTLSNRADEMVREGQRERVDRNTRLSQSRHALAISGPSGFRSCSAVTSTRAIGPKAQPSRSSTKPLPDDSGRARTRGEAISRASRPRVAGGAVVLKSSVSRATASTPRLARIQSRSCIGRWRRTTRRPPP
jgi:hypothetical protein